MEYTYNKEHVNFCSQCRKENIGWVTIRHHFSNGKKVQIMQFCKAKDDLSFSCWDKFRARCLNLSDLVTMMPHLEGISTKVIENNRKKLNAFSSVGTTPNNIHDGTDGLYEGD